MRGKPCKIGADFRKERGNMTLGERICQYRVQRRLSQQEVAEKLEVSRQSVSKWETDGAVPELDKLVKLCELFEVSLDELVRGEKPQEAEASESVEKGQEAVLTVQMTQSRPERSNAQVAAGAVMLAVGLIGFFSALVLPWQVLYLAIPLVICGILCLTMREKAGLACVVVVLLTVALLTILPILYSIILSFSIKQLQF